MENGCDHGSHLRWKHHLFLMLFTFMRSKLHAIPMLCSDEQVAQLTLDTYSSVCLETGSECTIPTEPM